MVWIPELKKKGAIVAYRGGGNLIDYARLEQTNCSALSILDSGNRAIENTLEAVSESLSAGAEVIHLNLHRTADNQLVVFHDWTLDCATDGTGVISRQTYSRLRQLDAGYGYSWDEGKTFPYRGKGFRISHLDEFLSRYPQPTYWLNLKENDAGSFAVLHTFLEEKNPEFIDKMILITSPKGVEWFARNAQNLKVTSTEKVKRCGMDYLWFGWAGWVPGSCRNTVLFIPPSKAKFFWGYPAKMAARFQHYGSEVYLWYEHRPVNLSTYDILDSGIGVITGDQKYFNALSIN